jgi:hypothetical protein
MEAHEYDALPEEVKTILSAFDDNNDLYKECVKIETHLVGINYQCNYGLAGIIYDVKPMIKKAKFFEVNGYWKDDKTSFRSALFSVDVPDIDAEKISDTTQINGVNDEDISFYGLDESEIKRLIEEGAKNDQLDFVITAYKPFFPQLKTQKL